MEHLIAVCLAEVVSLKVSWHSFSVIVFFLCSAVLAKLVSLLFLIFSRPHPLECAWDSHRMLFPLGAVERLSTNSEFAALLLACVLRSDWLKSTHQAEARDDLRQVAVAAKLKKMAKRSSERNKLYSLLQFLIWVYGIKLFTWQKTTKHLLKENYS